MYEKNNRRIRVLLLSLNFKEKSVGRIVHQDGRFNIASLTTTSKQAPAFPPWTLLLGRDFATESANYYLTIQCLSSNP